MSSFLTFLREEWYFAIPMLLMSLVAVTLTVWRILLNVNAGTDMGKFLPELQARLEKGGPDSAVKFCRGQPHGVMIPRLYAAGLENYKQGAAAMRRAMANTIELEILPDLNFLLAWILAIAKIATMVGLLGTVISMIKTFTLIKEATQTGAGGGAAAYAGAIGLALFATALGLVTAIPLVFAHVLFKDWIHRFELRMKQAAQKLIVLVQNLRPGDGKAAKPAGGDAPVAVAGGAARS
jgi:biopolymer transport protein ExbB